MSKMIDRLSRAPGGRQRSGEASDQMELFPVNNTPDDSAQQKSEVAGDVPPQAPKPRGRKTEARAAEGDAALRKELEALRAKLAGYEQGGGHESAVRGAEEALRRQRELEGQIDSLRGDIAEAIAAREASQKLLETAEARCAELEGQLAAGERPVRARGENKEKDDDYKKALAQANSEVEDLRAQFSHREAQFKAVAEEHEEKVRHSEARARKAEKQAEELRRALEEEKRARAADALRHEEREKALQAGQPAAAGGEAGGNSEQQRLQLEEREEALRLNIERFEAEQAGLNQELETVRAALADEKARAAETIKALKRQADRYEGEIEELKAAQAAPAAPDNSAQLEELKLQLEKAESERRAAVKALETDKSQAAKTFQKLQQQNQAREDDFAQQLAAQQELIRGAEAGQKQAAAQAAEIQRAVDDEKRARAAEQLQFRERERKLAEQLRAISSNQRQIEAELEREQARALTPSRMIMIAAAVLLLCGAAFMGGVMIAPSRQADDTTTVPPVAAMKPPAPAPQPAGATAPMPASRPALTAPLAVSKAAPAAPSSAAKPPPAWPAIQVAGVQSRRAGAALALVFDYGVFAKKTEMTAQAQKDLAALAAQLKPALSRFKLEIEGHTDSDPMIGGRLGDNRTLGLKRAQAVRDYLALQCGLPVSALVTTTKGEADPPHPNDTQESRRKNRTVVLKLTPLP